ncbi:helix-turn-helix domain-containing protein [Pontimicrobium sp. MEBiC06410]
MFLLKKNFLFFALLFSFIFSCSPKRETSSTKNIKKPYQDSIKKYIYSNPVKGIVYSKKFLEKSKQENNTKNILLALGTLAVEYEVRGIIDSTLYYYDKSKEVSKEPQNIIDITHSVAIIYENQSDYNKAVALQKECLELSKKFELEEGKQRALNALKHIKNKVNKSEEIIPLFIEAYNKESKKSKDKRYNLRYARLDLVKSYLTHKKLAKALLFSEEGVTESKQTKNLEFLYYYQQLRSRTLFEMKKIALAKTSSNETLETAKQLNNNEFINEANYVRALIYLEEGEPEQAIILLKRNLNYEHSPEQLYNYYHLMANSYEAIDSITLSNLYNQKSLKEKEKVSQKKLKTLDTIHEVFMKEEIEERERQERNKLFWIISCIVFIVLCILVICKLRLNQRQNQNRFDDLMLKIKDYEAQNSKAKSKEKITVKSITEKKDIELEEEKLLIDNETISDSGDNSYIIDDEKIEEILSKINKLEEKQYYLRQDCTLPNMAKKLKTNTSYLSKIINTHLNKSFSTYINELRINYVVIELKNNKRLRSYSIKGVAEEIGYKNGDSFARAFKASTGITPSVYIKKINEL